MKQSPIETLKMLILPVLSRPHDAVFRAEEKETADFITLTPHGADMGRMIGRDGCNIEALHDLVEFYSQSGKKRVVFALNEPEKRGERAESVNGARAWKPEPLQELIRDFLRECGVSTESTAQLTSRDGWRIMLSARLAPKVFYALNRWIAVIALSTGGKAFLDETAMLHE